MASAPQIAALNNSCCGGGGSSSPCVPVTYNGVAPDPYLFSLADMQSTMRLEYQFVLNGSAPFTLVEYGVAAPDVTPPLFNFYMSITGNVVNLFVDYTNAQAEIPSGPWAFTYKIRNCSGSEFIYNGNIQIIP